MRLLLVEDDEALAGVVRRGLAEEGYAVDHAADLVDARHALAEQTYDLAIVDLGLPDGDGLALCREVRESGRTVPVMVLTARDGLSDKVAGLDAGADDYLTKPFDFPELTARIRALLRRPARVHAPVLEVDDVRLDPASRRVWRGAVAVPLTPREFALLEYLMRHAGTVVSRSELYDHVWSADYDGLSNVVDVHIANIRRKLAVTGADDPLVTVRGVGYRIGDPA
ncbi:MAG: DNA-binding response regulator [Actinomyces sp.]|nr:MAG: DNA-binding response regulator [Actinomyces sp.]